jgi:hypothetical protein
VGLSPLGTAATLTAAYTKADSISILRVTRALHWSLSKAKSILSLWDPFKYYPPSYILVFLVASFLLAFPKSPIWIPLLPHLCYIALPSHHPWLDHSNYTWWRVQVMKLAVFSNLLSPHPSSAQILSSAPCSSLTVTDQVPGPYKTTGKITVLYILIFTVLD